MVKQFSDGSMTEMTHTHSDCMGLDALANAVARSLAKAVARSLAKAVARSLAKAVARSLANAVARSLANAVARSLANELVCPAIKSLRSDFKTPIE